ncbi:DUF3000 family protein [Nakamurella sp. YIM 132087]|uniref:DUF3000 family protein n=1 Tax=Nakamurella alba TaxID=2665158 RepID=A0A7K1FQK2_9ACTN|nr:DUF3000 domain-containing protein [Nakamurella alba]MTD16417.1 DUF3000 family protein [Nakamurella alba]
MTTSAIPTAPAEFREALDALAGAEVRPEIELGSLPAPTRLAPWTHALSAAVVEGGDRPESGSGRFVLLHDPDGVSVWNGTLRIVIFVTAEIDADLATDALLPEVAWSWLTDCLDARDAGFTALGGTVTATSSTRFGDIAGPRRTDDLEIRASWTATDSDALAHLMTFTDLLAVAAGLPPEGVAAIGSGLPPNVR